MSREFVEYCIKLIYPSWYADDYRKQRIGFQSRYKNYYFKGSKILIYITTPENGVKPNHIAKRFQQRLVGFCLGTGDWKDGEHFPDKKPGYPLNIPIHLEHEVNPTEGIHRTEILAHVPSFNPVKGMSFHQITCEQYLTLEKELKKRFPLQVDNII
jgi:hypothetical protein